MGLADVESEKLVVILDDPEPLGDTVGVVDMNAELVERAVKDEHADVEGAALTESAADDDTDGDLVFVIVSVFTDVYEGVECAENDTVGIALNVGDDSALDETVSIEEYEGVGTALGDMVLSIERVDVTDVDGSDDGDTLTELEIVLNTVTLHDALTDADADSVNPWLIEENAVTLVVIV